MDYDALAKRFGAQDAAIDYDKMAAGFGGADAVSPAPPNSASAPEQSTFDAIKQGAGDLAAGALRGAGSLGATILAPADMVNSALEGNGFFNLDKNRERRAQMDQGLQQMGADPNSTMFATGKLGGEIAGTAGVGGILANGVTRAANAIPAIAPYAGKIAAALESGGFRTANPAMVGPAPAANLASKVGDMALRTGAGAAVGGTAAGAIDPSQMGAGAVAGGIIPGGVKAAGALGSGVSNLIGSGARNVIGTMTGAGGEALKTAYQSGKSGAQSFVDNMRGKVDMTDVLDDAKAALSRMRIDRGNEYRSGMLNISADKTVLDMTPINAAVANIQSMGSFKGQPIRQKAASVVDEATNKVQEWASLNPAEYHTPEGLDALKQAIGDIRDSTQFGTSARKAVDSVYNAVKNQITAQAPVYSKVMKSYSDASSTLSEIERALSLGNKASVDTSMRKLQSLMRNNVNTNYGNRLSLARELEQKGGAELMPSIAGQALNSPTPRGLQGLGATAAGVYGLTNPAALAALPFQSPRLMGEAFYGAGRLRDLMGQGVNSVTQNPAIANRMAMLPNTQSLQSLMTIAPSVAMSR